MESDQVDDDIDGCIKSIHVRNFFCHENLEVNFNRNVNFIVGRNGSGKSAILTALVVGLGGRASATNRGNNLHSFIKKGANSATVEIKIKNNSAKAFKPNVYGDFITIVRNISASGGSSYKVKSATGEVISTKFEEVNAIILAHDIQVDNPISVLNQDDARSFHASDAKKKYSLFRKATNLDQTETNYIRALENCNKASAIWSRKNDACAELEKEYKKWKARYDQLQSRDEIEVKKQALQNEYYWSEIADLEKEAHMVQTQYDKQKARVEKLMEKLTKITQNYGSNSDIIQTLKSKLKEKNSVRSSLEQQLRELEAAARDSLSSQRAARQAEAKQAELLSRERRKVADLEREIHSIDSGSAASRRQELESKAAAARAASEAAAARYSTAQHDTQQARAGLQRAAALAERAAARAAAKRTDLKQLKQQLRELESRGGDSLAVYGAHMMELVARLQQAGARGEFSAPPRGPVGAYLKVKDKKWGGALEHILGGSIQTFCVNTPEDSRKLFEIMGKVYGKSSKPAVTCSKFLDKMHDVRRHSVCAGPYRSALDSLDVADPVVANYLIDSLSVERILLVPDHENATRLSDTLENVPENCSKIVTLDSTEYHPMPSYRSYGGAARPSRFLHLSTNERKKQVMDEISELESELRSLEENATELEQEAKQARENERSACKALQALLALSARAEELARVAAAALEQQQAPHHAVLVDELNISKEKLSTISEKLEELREREQQSRSQADQLDEQMKTLKTQLAALNSECRNLSEEAEQEQLKQDQGVTERQTIKQRIREDNSKLAQVENILEDKNNVISKKVEDALKLCPRIENPRDQAVVTSELKKTQLKLVAISADGLSKAQVAESLLALEKKFRRNKHTLDRLLALIEDIKGTTDKHLTFCHRVQTYIARRVQYCFQSILTLRGFSGHMDIDNGRGTLEIRCSGRSAGARAAASTASLSGGERSYSTVAFIMALWDCVELPFYVMDEFDVFMDNVNRKIVLELLIDHALKNKNRQFAFLTPQDASNVSAGPQISIHLMADPRP